VPGFAPADDAFCIEPGHERTIALRPAPRGAHEHPEPERPAGGELRAINLRGSVALAEAR
jgi:hypothetical protein